MESINSRIFLDQIKRKSICNSKQEIKGELYSKVPLETKIKIVGYVTAFGVAGVGSALAIGFTNKLENIGYAKSQAKQIIENENKDDFLRGEKIKEEVDNLGYDTMEYAKIYDKILNDLDTDDFKLFTGEFKDGKDTIEVDVMGKISEISIDDVTQLKKNINELGEDVSEKDAVAILGLGNFIESEATNKYNSELPRIK